MACAGFEKAGGDVFLPLPAVCLPLGFTAAHLRRGFCLDLLWMAWRRTQRRRRRATGLTTVRGGAAEGGLAQAPGWPATGAARRHLLPPSGAAPPRAAKNAPRYRRRPCTGGREPGAWRAVESAVGEDGEEKDGWKSGMAARRGDERDHAVWRLGAGVTGYALQCLRLRFCSCANAAFSAKTRRRRDASAGVCNCRRNISLTPRFCAMYHVT